MVLTIGRKIVVYPELLQVMQQCGLFLGIEATERELQLAGITCRPALLCSSVSPQTRGRPRKSS